MSPTEKKERSKKSTEPVTRKDSGLYDHFGESDYLIGKFERYLREFTFPRKELSQIRKAYDFAQLAHQNQMRDDAYPFILHPIRVTSILLHEIRNTNADVICGGLLHDVLEHCPVTLKELRNNFNDNVAAYVKTLTKPGPAAITKTDTFAVIRSACPEIQIIKLCDKLDNSRAMRFSQNKVRLRRYAKELNCQYIPLAHEINAYLHHELKTEQTVLQNRLKAIVRKTTAK